MTSIADLLTRIKSLAVLQQRPGKEIASASETQINQVSVPFSAPERSPTTLGYRGIESTLANRDKMLRKIDMPVFAGPLPFDWISRAERFFHIGNYNEQEKLHLVSLSLEGPVLQWFNGEIISESFTSWNQFTKRMLDRFGGPIDNDPAARLFCLRQEGQIEDYVNEFEALRNQVTGIDEKNLIKVFFNGLKPEMKEVIRMKEPVTLTDHKLAVLKMQSTAFFKVISSAEGGNNHKKFHKQSTGFRAGSFVPRTEAGANKENVPPQQGQGIRSRQNLIKNWIRLGRIKCVFDVKHHGHQLTEQCVQTKS